MKIPALVNHYVGLSARLTNAKNPPLNLDLSEKSPSVSQLKLDALSPILKKPVSINAFYVKNPKNNSQITDIMLRRLARSGAINYLGSGLLHFAQLVDSDDLDYQQSLRYHFAFKVPSQPHKSPSLDMPSFMYSYKRQTQMVSLELTLQSGTKVNFSMHHYQGVGISESQQGPDASEVSAVEINFTSSNTLSIKEKEQLAMLAKNIEQFATGFFVKEEAHFEVLSLNQFDVLKRLSFTAKKNNSANSLIHKYGLQFKYENNELQRYFKASFRNNESVITVSKALPFNRNLEAKKQAIEHYLELLEQSKHKSQANRIQTDMMQTLFKLAFAPTKEEQKKLKEAEEAQQQALFKSGPDIDKLAQLSFVPLPDFMFNFSSNQDEKSLWHERHNVRSIFKLQLSLSSSEARHADDVQRRQTAKFKLKGTAYVLSDYGLRMRISDYDYQAEKQIQTHIQKGRLKSATIEESYSANVHHQDFEKDAQGRFQLVREEHQIHQHHQLQDLMKALLKNSAQKAKHSIKHLLINPFVQGKRIYYDYKEYKN